jgi:hypothetical protein
MAVTRVTHGDVTQGVISATCARVSKQNRRVTSPSVTRVTLGVHRPPSKAHSINFSDNFWGPDRKASWSGTGWPETRNAMKCWCNGAMLAAKMALWHHHGSNGPLRTCQQLVPRQASPSHKEDRGSVTAPPFLPEWMVAARGYGAFAI